MYLKLAVGNVNEAKMRALMLILLSRDSINPSRKGRIFNEPSTDVNHIKAIKIEDPHAGPDQHHAFKRQKCFLAISV